ncbi:hypothetical protein V6x_36130 [Gimesia chilikensis]|uniref:Uncharacterized protein n=1 Tax=Gimesia chilikensis TaxID=2605989 RepID=A0A517WF56_9PLAN|nr:hypothetical protein V6x_36130 [Gimesia chilikensis]
MKPVSLRSFYFTFTSLLYNGKSSGQALRSSIFLFKNTVRKSAHHFDTQREYLYVQLRSQFHAGPAFVCFHN